MLNLHKAERGTTITRDRDGMAGTIEMVFSPGAGGRNMYGSPTALVRWNSGRVETIGPHIGMLSADAVTLTTDTGNPGEVA